MKSAASWKFRLKPLYRLLDHSSFCVVETWDSSRRNHLPEFILPSNLDFIIVTIKSYFNFDQKGKRRNNSWYHRHTKHHKQYYEQLYANKLDSLEETDEFLETYRMTRLNQEETENLNRLITRSEVESVIWNTPSKQKSRTRELHRGILSNLKRRTYTNPSQNVPKNGRWANTPKCIRQGHHYPDSKTRQRD